MFVTLVFIIFSLNRSARKYLNSRVALLLVE